MEGLLPRLEKGCHKGIRNLVNSNSPVVGLGHQLGIQRTWPILDMYIYIFHSTKKYINTAVYIIYRLVSIYKYVTCTVEYKY